MVNKVLAAFEQGRSAYQGALTMSITPLLGHGAAADKAAQSQVEDAMKRYDSMYQALKAKDFMSVEYMTNLHKSAVAQTQNDFAKVSNGFKTMEAVSQSMGNAMANSAWATSGQWGAAVKDIADRVLVGSVNGTVPSMTIAGSALQAAGVKDPAAHALLLDQTSKMAFDPKTEQQGRNGSLAQLYSPANNSYIAMQPDWNKFQTYNKMFSADKPPALIQLQKEGKVTPEQIQTYQDSLQTHSTVLLQPQLAQIQKTIDSGGAKFSVDKDGHIVMQYPDMKGVNQLGNKNTGVSPTTDIITKTAKALANVFYIKPEEQKATENAVNQANSVIDTVKKQIKVLGGNPTDVLNTITSGTPVIQKGLQEKDNGPGGFSKQTLDFIKKEEGYAPVAQWDYHQFTGGYGTRGQRGQSYTPESAQADLEHEVGGITKWMNSNIKVPLTENQKTALTSFQFNTGALDHILPHINEKDWKGAAEQMKLYYKAGGSPLQNLIDRRGRETGLMLREDQPS
jgi:GH24 family phage-related lysozyme (muramidase)